MRKTGDCPRFPSVRASYYVGYRYSFLPENKVHKEHLEEIAAFWDINGGSDIFISGVNHYSEGGNVLFLDDHVEWIPQELWVNQNMPIK